MNKFLTPFQKDGKWGYKDEDGNVVIPPKLEAAGEFFLGIAKITINNQIKYLDCYGNFFDFNKPETPENNDNNITDGADELVRFKKNERHGYKNIKGKAIVPPIYVAAWPFSEGLALVKLDLKWGYINSQGKIVIDFIYDFADSFSQGIARVMLDKKYGYINYYGEEFIPIYYDDLVKFNGKLAFFSIG